MSSVGGARSLLGASDETYDKLCDPCNYVGSKVEAVKFCSDCKEWLCHKCTDSHKKFKASRNHKILSVAQVPRQAVGASKSCIVLCENCQNVEVTDYCEQHNTVICQACRSVKHRKCNPKSVSEKGQSYDRNNFDFIVKRAKETEEKIDKFHRERKADFQKLSSLRETCAKEIRTFREAVVKWLNKLEQTATQELNDFAADEQEKLERDISAATTTRQMLEADSKLINDVMETSVIGEMFAVDVKVTNRLKEYEQVLHDLYQEATTPLMSFTRNKQLTDMLTQLEKLGNVTVDQIQTYKPKRKLFNDMKVKSSNQVNIKLPDDKYNPCITGCEVLKDGQIILCDYNNDNLKLLHSSFTVKEVLGLRAKPLDVSVINNSSAIITLPWLKQLQYMQLEPSLKSGRVIQLDKWCFGIAVAGEDLYVTLHNNPGEGEVRILDMEGSLKRRIGVNREGPHIFKCPYYLTQSATTGKIYVSDDGTHTVTCLMSDGSTVYQYNDKDLKLPQGVCVDDEENIIVCGRASNNVHIVTASGRKHGCLLTSEDEIRNLMSIAYRHTDDTLIIGCLWVNSLFVYKMLC